MFHCVSNITCLFQSVTNIFTYLHTSNRDIIQLHLIFLMISLCLCVCESLYACVCVSFCLCVSLCAWVCVCLCLCESVSVRVCVCVTQQPNPYEPTRFVCPSEIAATSNDSSRMTSQDVTIGSSEWRLIQILEAEWECSVFCVTRMPRTSRFVSSQYTALSKSCELRVWSNSTSLFNASFKQDYLKRLLKN
jgi:hypothetical protein